MDETTKVVVRPSRGGSDSAFLYATWRNALWFAERRDQKDADQFYKNASAFIASMVNQGEVRIAYLSDDPDMLLGWALLIGTRLEFVYVKIEYRREGIGRLLTRGFTSFSEPKTWAGKILATRFIKEKQNGRNEETQAKQD